MSNPLLPQPYVVDHLTFVGEGVWMIWFGKEFFFKPLDLEIFSLTYNSVRFFSSIIYVMSDIYFFTAGYYFSQLYPCKLFLLEISLQDIIHNPLVVGP